MLARIKFVFDTVVTKEEYEKLKHLVGEEIKRPVKLCVLPDGKITTFAEWSYTTDPQAMQGTLVKMLDEETHVALVYDEPYVVDIVKLFEQVKVDVLVCQLYPTYQDVNAAVTELQTVASILTDLLKEVRRNV